MATQFRNTFTTYNTLIDFDLVSSKSFIKTLNSGLIKYYTILINFLIIIYGVYLGVTTIFGWNVLVSEWTIFLLITRILFFLLFIFDFFFILTNSTLFKNYGRFKTFIDFVFLLIDLAVIVHLIILTIFRKDLSDIRNGSGLSRLSMSLRFLFCLSVFRMYKLCLLFKPLLNLSQGIFLTIRSLIWTGVFVFLVIYSCSIMTTWLLNDAEDDEMEDFWGSLFRSMYTLFTVLTLEGWNEVSNRTSVFYPRAKLFFVTYVSFTTLTVMNVVTGIILDTFISASEKLYAENFYKGTYKRQFDVSRLVNAALKRMKYSPLDVKESLENDCDFHMDNIKESEKTGIIGFFKKFIKNIFKKKRERKYMEGLNKFEESQGKCVFEKKEATSFETRSSEEPSTGISRVENSPQEKNSIKRSNSIGDSTFNPVSFEVVTSSISSPNLGRFHFFTGHNQGLQGEGDLEARSHFISEFKRYSNLSYEDVSRNQYGKLVELREPSSHEEIIDLDENDPSSIINDSVMEEALKVANISKYHAYDVLNMYYLNGFRKVKVSEFAICCSRISGNATNRELLSFELVFRRRLDNLERSISGLNEKMDKIIASISKN